MDIQAIIDGILDAGDQQISSIKKDADTQVSSIRAKAESEANYQKDRILKDAHVRLNRSQAVIAQRAYMQSLQMHANARQKLIMDVIAKTKVDISKLRQRKEYAAILEKFICDALETILPSLLSGQKVILHVDPRDKGIIAKLTLPNKDRIIIQYDHTCGGGCEAESEDGLVRTLNTFESRFERALPMIQQKLSVFFEEKITSS